MGDLFRKMAAASLVASALAPMAAGVQEHPRMPHRHPEGEKLVNPILPASDSAKLGAAIYAKSCASCHGPNGLGNGRLAAAMAAYGARPSNLADTEWQHGSTDGEIFMVIRDGIGPDLHMPQYQGKLSDDEVWHVVNYIRALGI